MSSKASAATAVTGILDHQRFPHIVDAIVESSDLATQLVFRATSRKFLQKVDDGLFEHVLVALRPFPPCYGAVLDATFSALQPHAPFARLPFLPWDRDTSPPTPPGDVPTEADLAGFDPTDPDSYQFPPVSVHTDARRAQLARVRVLDYHPFRGSLAAKIGPLITNVEVIRKRRPLPSAVHAPTTVDYLNITSPSCHRSGHIPWARFGAPSYSTRYVLHVSFDPSHPDLGEGLIYVDLCDVTDLVVVFTPQLIAPMPGMEIGPRAHDGMPRLGLLSGIMKSIAHTQWDVRSGTRVEFVGLERVPPGYLNLPAELTGDALFHAVNKEFYAMAEEWIANVRGANDVYREELELRILGSHSYPVKYTTLEQWHATAPLAEQSPCPMLPGVDEDARDANEWADGSRLMDTGPVVDGAHFDDDGGEFDFLPHDPWAGVVSEQAERWMDEHI